ncbi:50S ribosomal protein L3 [Escherichia coli]|uniref:50S ribosomal protein L3 n=1 Tax=Escherichia coli TaxID=562 RepID=A0A376MJE7_ECOLX|nr:50S ribosomal protein L3 [Escherichia coli]
MRLDLAAGVDVQISLVNQVIERLRVETMIGLVGKKVGMTRIFTEDGVSIQ